jgi:hypothetical protein
MEVLDMSGQDEQEPPEVRRITAQQRIVQCIACQADVASPEH